MRPVDRWLAHVLRSPQYRRPDQSVAVTLPAAVLVPATICYTRIPVAVGSDRKLRRFSAH